MTTRNKHAAGKSGARVLLASLPNSTYIFVVLFVAFLLWIPNFATPGNLATLLQQASILSLLSAAVGLSIMAKGIDLSVGSIVSLVGVIIAVLIGMGLGEFPAIVLGLAAATVFGLFNGFIVVKLGVVPFIATFGTLGIGAGLANLFSGKRALYLSTIEGRELWLIPLFQRDVVSIDCGNGEFFTINVLVVITVAVLALLIFLFKKTVMNAYVYAIGNNPEAAKLSNINVTFWGIFVYGITGLLAGVAGLLLMLRVNSAQPTGGEGLEFQAVVAAVLGGNLLSGGKGSLPGAVLGALVVYLVRNGLTLLGVHSNYVMVALGVVLVLGMIMNDIATNGFSRGRKAVKSNA